MDPTRAPTDPTRAPTDRVGCARIGFALAMYNPFHFVCVNFVRVGYPTRTQFPVEYGHYGYRDLGFRKSFFIFTWRCWSECIAPYDDAQRHDEV